MKGNLNNKIKKLLIIIAFVFTLFSPVFAYSQGSKEEIFKAEIIEILREQEKITENGSSIIQQNIKLKGLSGQWKNKEFVFYGISDIFVTKSHVYKKGDKVVVTHTKDPEGKDVFYINDYVRTNNIYVLVLVFILTIIIIGKWKGLKALIGLLVSFAVIMKFIIPYILAGRSPLPVAIIGSFLILLAIIYITEGFNKKSHLAIVSILFSLLITALLSIFFTSFIKLTGMAQEETIYLVGIGKEMINFKGLLLAGIMIGTLGVLDDIVISQIETVKQIKKANPRLSKKATFKMAYEVGSSHLGAVINTLFLAYAGVSLPLLILFYIGQEPFLSFSQVINNEIIATEITRTLVGVVGLTLAIPITNFLAVYFYSSATKKPVSKKSRFNKYVSS